MTIAEWDVELDAPEGNRLVALIESAGLAVFRQQPGFIRYRLMRAASTKTVAVAEWETEELGLAGSARYRDWLAAAGVKSHITMSTEAGPVLVSSDPGSA
jgi:hypothetical protein